MGFLTPLLLATLVAYTSAGPAGQRYTCAQSCNDATKFAYERGMSYTYDYHVQTSTTNSPTDSQDQVSLTAKAKAMISVIAPCEYVLTLSDVTLEGSAHSSDFSSELTKMPLKFTFDDGHIPNICHQPQDEVWAVNFKKGVLSAFQNTMTKLDGHQRVSELDITGECETDYRVVMQSSDEIINIERSKTSDSCTKLAVTSHTSVPGIIERLPLISSQQNCAQKIEAGIMQEVKCDQTLVLRPVSQSAGEATVTMVTTTLSLVDIKHSIPTADFELVTSTMAFDAIKNNDHHEGYLRKIESLLDELDRKSEPILESEVPVLFSELVENMRHLDQRQMSLVYEANGGSRVWRFLVDAAPMVATSASTAIVVELIRTGRMTPQEADIWFTSLAFVPNPEVDMFTYLPNIIHGSSSKKALLGVSAMVNTYCKKDSTCMELDSVREVLSAIEVNLGSACRSSTLQEKEKILTTLKAIGNAGHFMNSDILSSCYLEEGNPMEVRVAALEAWRRAPCSFDRSGIINIYLDSRQDSEIRITAYLSLMTCPTQELIDSIKDRLVSESVNQVGSFVWTHLTNVQESASHQKQWIRPLIGEHMLVNKFNISALKYSRNYESSFYMEELGFGSTVDSNVIFSSKSFLPRSGMVNLTLDFFGESINMLEIGGRIEGFEVFIEKFFSADGYYPEETVEAILKGMRGDKSSQATTLEDVLDGVTDEPEGSYYLRILGNDVQYHHFRGIEHFFEKKPDFNLVEMLIEFAKTGNVDYSKSYKLIDTEIVYSTIAGLPLTLKLNSTATVGIRMDGKFSARSLRDVDIQGHIYPSATIQTDATMFVDAHVTKSGLKVTSNIQTSSFFEGNVKINGGKMVDISLNMPQEKVELLSVKTEKIFIENDRKKIGAQIQSSNNMDCTGSGSVLGVKLCTAFSSNKYGTEAGIYMVKTDTHTGYNIKYLNDANSISFMMDTPGSSIERKISVVGSHNDHEIAIDAHTPWKSLKAIGSNVIEDNGKRYEFEVIVDDSLTYKIATEYSTQFDGSAKKYQTALNVQTPTTTIIDMEGNIDIDPEMRIMSIGVTNQGATPISFQFSISWANMMKKLETSLISPILTVYGTGSLRDDDIIASQLDFKYSFMGQQEHSIKHHARYQNMVTDQENNYSGAFIIQVSQVPSININTKGKLTISPGRIETSALLHYGIDNLEIKTDNILTYAFEDKSKAYDLKMSLASPTHDIDFLLTKSFLLKRNYLLVETNIRLNPELEMSSKMEIGYSNDVKGFGRLQIFLPEFQLIQEVNYSKISHKYYTAQVLGSFNNYQWNYEGSYQDRSVRGESVDLELKGKSRINEKDVSSTGLIIKANSSGIIIDSIINYNGIQKFAKLNATPTAIKLEANIIKHILLDAKIILEGYERSLQVTGSWDIDDEETHFIVSGNVKPNRISGNFKYGEIEKGFLGELLHDGVLIELQIEPLKTITGSLKYKLGDEMNISATVLTPFPTYEKQDAMFTFTRRSNTKFATQANVTWRNSQLIAFTTSGGMDTSGLSKTMSIEASIICNPSVFGFEHGTFKLQHSRESMNINSILIVTIDSNEIVKGKIQNIFNNGRQDIEASLITPISDEFSFEYHTIFSDTIFLDKMDIEIVYGKLIYSSSFLRSELDDNGTQIEYTHSSSIMPDFKIVYTQKSDDGKKTIVEVQGIYGDHKFMAQFNFEKKLDSSEQKVLYSIDGRVVFPLIAPITGSLTISITNDGQILSDFEISRFWTSYGSLKIHANFNIQSLSNSHCLISIISPDIRATIDALFKYQDTNVESYIKSSYNGEELNIAANGSIDIYRNKALLRGSVMTKESVFIKFVLDHEQKSDTSMTELKLKIGDKNYDIRHQLSFNDKFNWNNKLEVNDMLLRNNMYLNNENYSHDFEWIINGKFVKGEGSVTMTDVLQHYARYLEANLKLSSYWSTETTAKFKYANDDLQYINEFNIENANKKIDLKTVYKCMPNDCSVKLNLDTSFLESLTFEGELKALKDLKLLFLKGDQTTIINLTGFRNTNELFGSIGISSSYLPHDIGIECEIRKINNDTVIALIITANKTYEGKMIYSKLAKNGKLSLEIKVPGIHLEDVVFNINYDLRQLPATLNLSLKLNNSNYDIQGSFTGSSLTLQTDFNGMETMFASDWTYNKITGNFSTTLTSPSKHFENFHTEGTYDAVNKMVNFVLKYGSENIVSFFGKIDTDKRTFESRFSSYNRHYTVLASFDNTSFKSSITALDKVIEIDGIYNVQNSVGQLAMEIKLPYSGFEMNSLTINYKFETEKVISLKAVIGDKELSLIAVIDHKDWLAPKFTINITTFIDQYKMLGGTAKYNLESAEKTCEVHLYRNDDKIIWSFDTISENPGKGATVIKVRSTLAGYESFEMGLDYLFSRGIYIANIYDKINDMQRDYSFKINISSTNSIEGEITSPFNEWKKITIAGNSEIISSKISGSLVIGINDDLIRMVVAANYVDHKINVIIRTPYESYKTMTFDARYNIWQEEQNFEIKMSKEEDIYSINFLFKQSYEQGEVLLAILTPLVGYYSIGFKGSYNFLQEIKKAEVELEFNGEREYLSSNVKVNDNNILLIIETPFEGFRKITMSGDLTNINGKHSAVAKIETEYNIYSVNGEINLIDKHFNLRTNVPIDQFGSLEISGQQTPTGYIFYYITNENEENITLDYSIDTKAMYFKLNTPFRGYTHLLFEYQYETERNGNNVSIMFEKEDIKLSINGRMKYTVLKSNMILSVEIPTENHKFMLKANYDFTGNNKIAEISGIYNSIEQSLKLAIWYELNSASIRVAVPIINKDFGIEYSFNVDRINKTINGSFTGIFNSVTHQFTANAKVQSNTLEIRFRTPFENFENIHLHTSIDLIKKNAKGNITFGSYECALNFKYSMDDILLNISSPFDMVKQLKLSSVFMNTSNQKGITFSLQYNDHIYEFIANYQPENIDERVLISMIKNEDVYKFSLGGELEERKLYCLWSLQTPLEGMTDLRFIGKMDTTSDDKAIEISMQNENDIKVISITGKFVGDLIDFRIRSPFSDFNNFRTYGSLNRSKRSLEFMMMKDQSRGNIRASFNSLNVHITSPYESLKESSLLIEKPDAGGFKLQYKRADNHVEITASPSGIRNTFDIVVNTAIPGWEFLALAGRLDRDDLRGYISGQINEEKMTVQGGGKYSRRVSDLKFEVTTPYANYRTVSVTLDFNTRRKDFNFLASSSSSDFRIKLNTKPDFSLDVFVPNSQESTIITASLAVFNGNIDIKSRFLKCRTFSLQYKVSLERDKFEITNRIEHNGLELFKLDFTRGDNKAHLMIHARRGENHSVLHFQREGFETIEFIYNRNGKEFKIEAQGTGNLPTKGSLDIVINNSFRTVPRAVNVHIEIDRSGSPKQLKMEITMPGNKLYIFDLKYNADLRNREVGDYKLSITTPQRRSYPWQNVAGSWNLSDHNNAEITFEYNRAKYVAKGKFGLHESNIVVSNQNNNRDFLIEWRWFRTKSGREVNGDYYLKLGTQARFFMAKLKGNHRGLEHGESEWALQASRFMSNEIKWTVKWHRDESGLSGTGAFKHGQYHGTYTLKRLKRDATTRSAVISFEALTNIPNYSKITIEGEYSFDNEAVAKLDIIWDNDKVSLNFNINDISSNFTQQTASFTLPGIGDVNVRFGHDFRNKKKTFTAVGQLLGRVSKLNAEWNRNKDFTKLSGKIDIDSIILGLINIVGSYDVRNIHNARAEITYTRNDDKNVHIKWRRVFNSNELDAEVLFESSFESLPTAKVAIKANLQNGFHLQAVVQAHTEVINLAFNIEPNSITGELTSPIRGFEHVTGSFTYSTRGRNKTATLRYQRGDKVINMDLNLVVASKKAGTLTLTLETPFEFVQTLSLDANWKNGKGELHYKRNDISYNFSGQAQVKTGRSSFEILFIPSSSDPIKIAFNFNAGSFITGRGTQAEDIAKMELEILGKEISFDVKGFRNRERVVLEVEAKSSFEVLNEFGMKLDSELSTQKRDGLFDIKVNNFHFKIHNHFERRPQNGFYWKSEIDSSLTDLPGLTIGFGKEGEEYIVTVGVGENREITVSFAAKDHFRRGFSGKISLPRRGIVEAGYDVNYSFSGNDVLKIDFQIQLEPRKVIEAEIVYNSDGVRARLSSPRTGPHSARVRRSVTDNGFFVELGVDDYNLSLQGDIQNTDIKRGFTIGGEVFGRKISIDTLFQADGFKYVEGKFIINTTIEGYESLGGLFTLSNIDKKIQGRAELNLPSYVTPKMYVNVDLDLNNKMVGLLSLDVSGEVIAMHYDFTGGINQGYEGHIKIRTPFHLASELNLTGKFGMTSFKNVETSFKFDYPMGSQNIIFKYNIDSDIKFIETKIENISRHYLHIKLNTDISNKIAEYYFATNGHAVNFQSAIETSKITAKVYLVSTYLSNPISTQFTLVKGVDWNNINTQISISAMEETHYLEAKFLKNRRELEISSLIQSTFAGGRRFIALKHTIPENYITNNFDIEIVYSGDATHQLLVKIDTSNYFKINLELDSPLYASKFELSLQTVIHTKSVYVILELPQSTHKAAISLLSNILRTKSDSGSYGNIEGIIEIDLEVISSYLSNAIIYHMKSELLPGKVASQSTFSFGKIHQSVIASYSYTSDGVNLKLEVDAPLYNINKASITADLIFKNTIKATVIAIFLEQTHKFSTEISTEDQRMFTVIKSNIIPGGIAKAEASIDGNSPGDLKIDISFRLNKKTWATKLKLNAISINDTSAALQVKTPFRGYRKLDFEVEIKNDDMIKFMFFAKKPIGYKFELASGKSAEGYTTLIDVRTPLPGLETMSTLVKIPIFKIAPKILLKLPTKQYGLDFDVENQEFTTKLSTNLNLDGSMYGAGFGLRYKAPYELSCSYNVQKVVERFHIMMDSSILSLVTLYF